MTNPFYLSKFWKALRQRAVARDGHRCSVPGCSNTESTGRLYVDHIETRPNVTYPTAADTLGNLRTLCALHDNAVKEQRSGKRRQGGKLYLKGCDPSGRPLDPNHPWNRKVAP